MRQRVIAFIAIGLVWLVSDSADAQIRAETIVRGLVNPVAVVADPTDRSRLLIVEQRGLIRVVQDGRLLEEPFLDLRNDVRAGGEQGLLGMVLAPDYADTRRLYVNFTNRDGDTVVARFTRHPDFGTRAVPESRFDLRWPDGRRMIDQPFTNHNGGHLAFGPDTYLYIGLGDGGSGGDPMNLAQNPQSLLGKMLRVDVSVSDDDARGYRVPEDNPFVDSQPIRALTEIWSFGWRNPWRYSFDDWTRGGIAAMLAGDVGQNAREEINFEPSGVGGRNYGWRLREGRQPYDGRTPAAYGPLIDPNHDYPRSVGTSITGGLVYRGAALDPQFNGRYFYADYVAGRVFSIGLHLLGNGEATADDEREHTERLGGANVLGNVSAFGQDADGELLVLNYRAGTIVRVVPDLSLVPAAPLVTSRRRESAIDLEWTPAGGVAASAYAVEVVREGRVSSRQVAERPLWSAEAASGDCFRVRGVAPGGSGPASSPVCVP